MSNDAASSTSPAMETGTPFLSLLPPLAHLGSVREPCFWCVCGSDEDYYYMYSITAYTTRVFAILFKIMAHALRDYERECVFVCVKIGKPSV